MAVNNMLFRPCLGKALCYIAAVLLLAPATSSSPRPTAAAPAFLFDPQHKHEEITVFDGGKAAEKNDGEDYQTVLLRPAIPLQGRSFVEFLIEKQAAPQCFMGMGVCQGTHDYVGGRSAMAAKNAWMLSTHSGKRYQDGGIGEQFLRGIGTPPFYPDDDPKVLGSVRPREGDKVGLLLDRDARSLSVSINGVDQGVMASELPENADLYFTVDLSDDGQRVSITSAAGPQP